MDPVLIGIAVSFCAGYVVGRLDEIVRLLRGGESQSFVASISREQKQAQQQRRHIQIDEAKFVTDIPTDDMQSLGGPQLGTVTQSNDDISDAAKKLANLKKLKG
jgi:NCAIR mutase (PurE)-related protein